MPQKQTKSLEEVNQMLCDTMESRAATGRQTMRALLTEPIEILRYALSELEQTMRPEDEAPSFVHLSHILNEGITFLAAEAATVIIATKASDSDVDISSPN